MSRITSGKKSNKKHPKNTRNIRLLIARQIFDSRGVPTIEVDLVTDLGLFRIAVPSTDKKRVAEAFQMRDNKTEYLGMGVSAAVKNINSIIGPELRKLNLDVTMQKEIDEFMISLDGTEDRSRLGANAIMCVSMVIAKAGAAKKGSPLYRHVADLAGITNIVLPVPHFTILMGGICTSNMLPYQEYIIMPTGAQDFAEAMRIGTEIYISAKNTIQKQFGVECTYVSDAGGFSIPINTHRDALNFMTEIIRLGDYKGKVEIALNAAASDFCKNGLYDLNFKSPNSTPNDYVTGSKLAEEYISYNKEFGVCSVEDPFDIDDWESWSNLAARSPFQLIGNDLTQTNKARVETAVEKKAANTLALRLSQCATLTELIESFKLMRSRGISVIVSDRWGDTEDCFLADLAVGLSAGQLKCGAPSRGEKISKYNHVLRIEEELGSLSKYAGKRYRVGGAALNL